MHVGNPARSIEAARVASDVAGGEVGVDGAPRSMQRLVEVAKEVDEDPDVEGCNPERPRGEGVRGGRQRGG